MKPPLFFAAALLGLSACSGTQVLNTLSSSDAVLAQNLIYDDATGQRLDIYTPEQARSAPVVVFFYGGRWSEGDKADYEFVGQSLAQRGFVAVLPSYREFPAVKFPAFVEDGARAVAWVRANIARYGGSPSKLFVAGHSSGAHIAAMLALDEQYLQGVGGSRLWLKGMVGLAGPYDFLPLTAPDLREIFGPPEQFEKSQPIFYVDGQNPPLLLMHGEDDDVVWVKNTRNLARAVKQAGGAVESVIYPEMSHTRMIASLGPIFKNQSDVLDSIAEFINRVSRLTLTPADVSGVESRVLQPEQDLPQGTALEAPPAQPPAPILQ